MEENKTEKHSIKQTCNYTEPERFTRRRGRLNDITVEKSITSDDKLF